MTYHNAVNPDFIDPQYFTQMVASNLNVRFFAPTYIFVPMRPNSDRLTVRLEHRDIKGKAIFTEDVTLDLLHPTARDIREVTCVLLDHFHNSFAKHNATSTLKPGAKK